MPKLHLTRGRAKKRTRQSVSQRESPWKLQSPPYHPPTTLALQTDTHHLAPRLCNSQTFVFVLRHRKNVCLSLRRSGKQNPGLPLEKRGGASLFHPGLQTLAHVNGQQCSTTQQTRSPHPLEASPAPLGGTPNLRGGGYKMECN